MLNAAYDSDLKPFTHYMVYIDVATKIRVVLQLTVTPDRPVNHLTMSLDLEIMVIMSIKAKSISYVLNIF